jgi:2-methylcitrate dehydratase PrpD
MPENGMTRWLNPRFPALLKKGFYANQQLLTIWSIKRLAKVSATDELLSYTEALRYEDLPLQTVESVKTHILDTFSAIIAGSTAEGPKNLVKLVKEWGGRAEGTIFVYGDKVPLPNAAWVNSSMSRGFDFESLVGGGATHVPGSIVPAALALSEYSQNFKNKVINGKDLIVAIALGIDLNWRLRVAGIGKSTVMGGGWLAETFSPPAIAALGGKLLGFNREKIANAMGIGYNQCCGHYGATVGEGGGLMAQVSQGLGTKAGVLSVLLADRGFTAFKEVIDGRWGLYRMYANGQYDPDILTGGLGKRFEHLNPNIKRYPGCGATQASVYAALELAREHNIRAEDVAKVRVYMAEVPYRLVGENKDKPPTPADALWNNRYSTAVALVKGKIFVDDFTEEAMSNPRVLELLSRVEIELDKSLTTTGDLEVEIKTGDGKSYRKKGQVMPPPMSRAEIIEKFNGCNRLSAKPLPEKTTESFIQMINKLQDMHNVTKITSIWK